jgi:hypothetical protein
MLDVARVISWCFNVMRSTDERCVRSRVTTTTGHVTTTLIAWCGVVPPRCGGVPPRRGVAILTGRVVLRYWTQCTLRAETTRDSVPVMHDLHTRGVSCHIDHSNATMIT